MADNFEKSLKIIFRHEGFFSNHPQDPGGKTRYGITYRTFRNLYPAGTFEKVDRKLAAEIYRDHYWVPCRCEDLPAGIDLAVFDSAVNQGQPTAKRILQKAAGVKVDGIIGPKTLAAIRADTDAVLTEFMARRAVRYGNLWNFLTFGLGWMRRLLDVHREAMALRDEERIIPSSEHG